MRIVTRLSLLTVALGLFTACGDDDPTPPTQNPTLAVSATTNTATVARGGTATYPITITRGGGFTGQVTLAAENVPTGVTATFTPSTLPNGTTTSNLTLVTTGTATAPTSTVTVRATGTGVTPATTTVTLNVTQPSIALAAGSTTGTVLQGATTTIPINITRNNFNDPVTVAITGLPTGVTATLNPTSPLGAGVNATTLTLTAAQNAAVTTTPQNITITASGTGVTAQTATVALNVGAGVAPGFTVTPSAATVTATAGQSGTSTLTLARQGGFTGDVGLTVTGAPAGVTATLTPTSLTGTTLTSTLNIATTAAAVPGTYTLNVVGASTGQTNRTVPITLTINAAPGITLGGTTGTPAAVTAVQGGTATSTLVLARQGGFTGDVALTASGLPTGTTIAFAPTSLTGTTANSVATLTVGAATAPGTYNVVITGTGPGGVTTTRTIPLTVTPSQTITTAASNVSVQQGATGTSNITLTRTGGYAGDVGLTVTGLPAGVTATFNPTSVTGTGTTSALSLAVGPNVAPGMYTGTITGAGTGVTNATGTFTLTVTAAPIGGDVAFRFCAQNQLPSFFAFRNGTSGAWTTLARDANNQYNFALTSNAGQVAYATPNALGGVSVTVLYYTAREFPGIAAELCRMNPATRTVTGTVTGLAAGQSATLTLGRGSVTVNQNGAFTITGATAGAADLIATRTTTNQTTLQTTIDRVIVRRALATDPGNVIGTVVDFNSAEAQSPSSAQFTIANLNTGETLNTSNVFQSGTGSSSTFALPAGASATTSPATFFGLPTTLTQSGDLNSPTVVASSTSGGVTNFRGVNTFGTGLMAGTLTLGSELLTPTFTTVATSPYARIRATGPWQDQYGDAVRVNYRQENGRREWTIGASRDFFAAAATNWELEIPDLTGLPGFSSTWGLVAGQQTQYRVDVFSGFPGLTAMDPGTTFRFAGRSGVIVP